MAEVNVYKFEYVKEKSETRWTAYIAGYTQQETTDYLLKEQGQIRLETIGRECRLDALTDQLRKKIVGGSGVEKKKRGRPVQETKDTIVSPDPVTRKTIKPKLKK